MMDFFQPTYASARQLWLDCCCDTHLVTEHYVNAHFGPRGEELALDVAFLGRIDAPHKLVIVSGTHGVEGFAGSAVQLSALQKWQKTLPDKISVIFLHALNPYGFAWIRRVNEDNVDLNRNFVDHDQPHPPNHAYAALADAICPPSWALKDRNIADRSILHFVKQHGVMPFQALVSLGQYDFPRGLMFGGHQKSWSNHTLSTVLTPYVQNTKHLIVIDIHTGLGDFGHGELISCLPKSNPHFQWGQSLLGPITSVIEGDAISPLIQGDMIGAVEKMFAHTVQNIAAVVLEFGTCSPLKVFHALRAENWYHFHGDLHHSTESPFKKNLKEAFYPESLLWKSKVLERGMDVIDRAIDGLAKAS